MRFVSEGFGALKSVFIYSGESLVKSSFYGYSMEIYTRLFVIDSIFSLTECSYGIWLFQYICVYFLFSFV